MNSKENMAHRFRDLPLQDLRAAAEYEGGISRRLLLAWGASLAALPALSQQVNASQLRTISEDPFQLGVASGEPQARSVVIWTRLAPSPLAPHGGMKPEPVLVSWEVAEDDQFRTVAASGETIASPRLGHSVHVEVDGLKPDRWYWFRFTVGDAQSPVGRTRTFPRANADAKQLDFAVASCQNFEQGLFTAYEQMAEDELDLVIHLGDYIYEYAGIDGRVRKHQGGEIQSLEDYRTRISQYRADPLLRNMHARCPWLVTWDDHEVDNNYANNISEQAEVDSISLLQRRTNAYQAYYEMMPLRKRQLPSGPNMRLFRKSSFGRLADFLILDTRQYRDDQPNGDRKSPLNDEALKRDRTMVGATQLNWTYRNLVGSNATWNVLAQQVMMGLVGFGEAEDQLVYSMDQWPGYAAEREQILRFMQTRQVPNPVVLTGDIHSNWVNDLRINDREPDQDVVATEFVGTSISSGGNGTDKPSRLESLYQHNPSLKYHNAERGYVRCRVTPAEWNADFVVVDDVLKPGGACQVRKSFVVEAGKPGAVPN